MQDLSCAELLSRCNSHGNGSTEEGMEVVGFDGQDRQTFFTENPGIKERSNKNEWQRLSRWITTK